MIGEKIFVDEEKVKNTGSKLFYASVNKKDDHVFTTSSRSLAIVGISDTIAEAELSCEKGLEFVKGEHIFIRHDIGKKKLLEKKMSHIKELNIM